MILFFSFDSLNVSAPNLLQMIIRVWKLIDTNHWMNFWLNEITTKNEKKKSFIHMSTVDKICGELKLVLCCVLLIFPHTQKNTARKGNWLQFPQFQKLTILQLEKVYWFFWCVTNCIKCQSSIGIEISTRHWIEKENHRRRCCVGGEEMKSFNKS